MDSLAHDSAGAHAPGMFEAPVPSKVRLAPILVASLSLLTFAAACSDDEVPVHGDGVVIDTVDGIERIVYPAGRGDQLGWTFDTLAVVGGSVAEDPDYQFGGVSAEGLAADSDGNLYLLDSHGSRILGYRPDGSFLGRWGREGSGPGEIGRGFSPAGTMAMGPGDTLWIGDGTNQRFTLLPVDGGKPASIPLSASTTAIDGKMEVDSSGVLAMPAGSSFLASAPQEMPSRPLVRYDRRDGAGDTLWVFPAPVTDVAEIRLGSFSPTMMWSQIFSPGFSWLRFTDGGLAIQEAAAYEIQLTDRTGSVRRIIRREPPPRMTREEDRQVVLDTLSGNEPEEFRRQRVHATTFAETIPRIVEMRRDTRNRLWVGISEEVPGVVERIDVYGRDGILLGELRNVELPDFFFGDGNAVILDADDLNVQRATIIRILERDLDPGLSSRSSIPHASLDRQ